MTEPERSAAPPATPVSPSLPADVPPPAGGRKVWPVPAPDPEPEDPKTMFALLVAACILSYGRALFARPFEGFTTFGSYQAFAHLFVGALLGALFLGRWSLVPNHRLFLLIVIGTLTGIEIGAFLLGRFG